MVKHTPAPWCAIYSETRRFHGEGEEKTDITQYKILSEKTRGELIGLGHTNYESDEDFVDNVDICSQFWGDMSDEEAMANANLIASAPELLEALLTALPYVEDVLGNPEQLKCFKQGAVQRDVKQIKDALRKAGAA